MRHRWREIRWTSCVSPMAGLHQRCPSTTTSTTQSRGQSRLLSIIHSSLVVKARPVTRAKRGMRLIFSQSWPPRAVSTSVSFVSKHFASGPLEMRVFCQIFRAYRIYTPWPRHMNVKRWVAKIVINCYKDEDVQVQWRNGFVYLKHTSSLELQKLLNPDWVLYKTSVIRKYPHWQISF